MSATSSPFSLREFFQLVFPSVVALSLFVPLYSPLRDKVTIEGLLFAALVLGLVLSSPADTLSKRLVRWIPFYRKAWMEADALLKWTAKSLNLERLETYLTKDERDYIDVSSSLSICYRQVASYLFVYVVCNGILWYRAVTLREPVSHALAAGWRLLTWNSSVAVWNAAMTPATPMMGQWSMPTIVVIAVALLIMSFLLRDSLSKQNVLFKVSGQYENFAVKYQKQDGDIARAIWGQVLLNETSAKRVEVIVMASATSGGRQTSESTKTDDYGLFAVPTMPTADIQYDVSVLDQAEGANMQREQIRCLIVRRTPVTPRRG